MMWCRLCDNILSSNTLRLLINLVKEQNLAIHTLKLSNDQLYDDVLDELGECIKSNKNINYVCLDYNHITDKGLEMLAKHLNENLTLKRLDLFGNVGVTDNSISLLLNLIKTTHIEDIGINDTRIHQANILALPLAHNVIRYQSNILDLNYKWVFFRFLYLLIYFLKTS